MTAFVLPNLDQSTIDELRKRIPDMSEIDLPRLEKVAKDVGKSADQAIDRLLGRSRMPVWPWVAASIAIVAIAGAAAAWFTWFRRPSSVDTLADEAVSPWQSSGADTDSMSDLSTDRTIDHSTTASMGAFGDRTADEYPIAEA
jgi:hypothetical protein